MPQPGKPSQWHLRVKAYIALTKPRVIELLLVTTVPAMVCADRQFPSWWLISATLVGGALAAGSANALNCYFDRDIDRLMSRTSRRPLAKYTVRPGSALIFGAILGVLSLVIFWFATNWLAMALAIAFYVLVYTLGVKRRTSQNIVWGGAAGCAPVLIGWAAVTGDLSWPAWALFGVVFFWTPPHFWALAIKFKRDYAAAGVPMLPVVNSLKSVTRHIVVYSWIMVATSMTLLLTLSWIYAITNLALGIWFIVVAHQLHRRVQRQETAHPMRLFHVSISYLTGWSVAVVADVLFSWAGIL